MFFPRPSGFSGTAALGPCDTHNQHPLLTQFCSTIDSVGWLPVDHHLLVLLHYALLQHPRSSKDGASTGSDINASRRSGGGFPRHSSGSPHPRSDTGTLETLLQLSVTRCPLAGSSSRSCTGGSVRGTNQGKNVMLPASPRRQGVSSVHPQRYQGFDPTFAQGVINILQGAVPNEEKNVTIRDI